MYNYIKGKIIEAADNFIVVECNGIGYEMIVSNYCLSYLQNNNQTEAQLFTHLAVREDNMSLYGFYSKEERAIFHKLISISGIGPKGAIAVLSGLPPKEFAEAIVYGDITAISSIKGIGKKTAERIILELKEKVSIDLNSDLPKMSYGDNILNEAVLALISLGIPKAEALNRAKKVRPSCETLEDTIKAALKN